VDKAECGKEAVESWNILVFAFAIIMLSPEKWVDSGDWV